MPLKSRLSLTDTLVFAIAGLLTAALIFGGASRLHELRLALVELASLPVLILVAWRLSTGLRAPTLLSLQLLGAILLVPLLQLTPLPPGLWSGIPGRESVRLALEVAGLPAGWLPLSLVPDKTWRSFLALLPPAAMFLAVSLTQAQQRVVLVRTLLFMVVSSVVLGAAQLVSGDSLYLWPTTDSGTVVGFFANRNHLATLCLLAIPFATVQGARAVRRADRDGRMTLWLSVMFVALMILAVGVIRSRMGVVLLAPTLAFSLLGAWIASGGGRPKLQLLFLTGAAVIGIGAVSVFALGPLMERFDASSVREGRFENWPIVASAAEGYLPLGSGLGSFDSVFRSVEPLESLDSTFFNQAHNDYLETWLETGWIGAAILLVFGVWFSRRSWAAWRSGPSTEHDLERAATVAIGVVLLHSTVDYPLRTETIAVVFAFCCAVLEFAGRPAEKAVPRLREHGKRRLATSN